MSTLPWWEWRTPRERLSMWLKAILGGRRYRVRFDTELPNPGAISANGGRLLVLNPASWNEENFCKWQERRETLHPVPFRIDDWETWSWLCCKAVGAHEVGHAYFSETPPEEPFLAKVVNLLDDERIERGMASRYPVLAPYFDLVGDAQWADLSPIPEDKRGDPFAVLQAALLWRWEHDLPHLRESKICLSPAMHDKWDEVRSLVEGCWTAPSYPEVVALARQILAILGLPADRPDDQVPDWLKALLDLLADLVAGLPLNPSGAERIGRDGIFVPNANGEPDQPSGLTTDAPPVPDDDNPSKGVIQPMPFSELEAAVTPWVNRLVAELAIPAPDVEPEPAPYGGRFSLRQALRDPERPFLAPTADGRSPEGMALDILGDRSGSMGWRDDPKMQAAQAGVMTLHLACQELKIPHAISLFDDQVILKDYEHRGEMTKALIAGWEGETDEEQIDVLLRLRGPILLCRPEPVKVILVVHDGYPVVHNEADRIRKWIAAHPQIIVVGVYLGNNLTSPVAQREASRMAELFPRLVAAEPADLPHKLGAVLRALHPQST